MSDRIPCKNIECKALILPATVKKTGGYCMPCYQAIKRKEYEEYIKENKKDVDLYEGVNDYVDIIKIMNRPKKYDPLINYIDCKKSTEEIYSSLMNEDIDRLKGYVLDLINSDDLDTAKEILLPLVCITDCKIEECLIVLVKKSHYYPGILFKNASAQIRDDLISRLSIDSENRNHILYALSWIGDEKVVNLFSSWRKNPPSWKADLYVPPENYSFESGWELTECGARKNLFFNECYPFEQKKVEISSSLNILQKHEDKCTWCGTSLTTLFDFDLSDPKFSFLNIRGSKLRITTCHICTCYGIIYTDIDYNGSSKWSQFNKVPRYLPNINPDEEESFFIKKPLRLSDTKRNYFYAASWLLGVSGSQVGGHPTWIQYAEYPQCPKCNDHMMFLGQLECSDFEEYGEGIYYSFICKECNIAATTYQQT